MSLVLISPPFKDTAFRAFYDRLVAKGMRPSNALGHLAGKLAVVLYWMLRRKELYNKLRHREALGLPQKPGGSRSSPMRVRDEVVQALGDIADLPKLTPKG